MSKPNEPDANSNEFWERFASGVPEGETRFRRLFHLIPSDPRCKLCGSPFGGIGGPLMRAIGKDRSNMNPNLCNMCDQVSRHSPGGVEMEMAMLFADMRGSTTLAEGMSPAEFGALINRFYTVTTNMLAHHDALIDKLKGDEVAAFFMASLAGPDRNGECTRAARRGRLVGLQREKSSGRLAQRAA